MPFSHSSTLEFGSGTYTAPGITRSLHAPVLK